MASPWMAAAALLLVSACGTTSSVTTIPTGQQALLSDDDDFDQLLAQVRNDLSRNTARETSRNTYLAPPPDAGRSEEARRQHQREFTARARALFAPLSGVAMSIPVVGVYSASLDDNWHAPRDGGSRLHKGIDIFARKGTPVVAVTDGIVSFIGDEPKGGHCVWLSTDEGTSFYYAHLDRWAPGLYEGMEVSRGDVLGFVGQTGNARGTFPHLHFGINQNDEMINPYPVLVRAATVSQAHLPVGSMGGGSSFGSR